MTMVDHVGRMSLPDTAYNMWTRGELDDFVHAPEGHRVEVIEGEIVVSPAPVVAHGNIVHHITRAMERAAFADPSFPWSARQMTNLSLLGIEQGYIPDLVVAEEHVFESAGEAEQMYLVADEIEMVVEVTSKDGAVYDRPPAEGRALRKPSKWSGYARVEIPYYLLVDRSPKIASTRLYSIPDAGTGAYLHSDTWAFGETVRLPEPFGVEIDTRRWTAWKD
ncbi:hypothetical protein GNZ18_37815 [Actinomadura sp. NEAU-AAG5]|uniref:Putative restriction endonuclease domain-containing protein n=2 Tax=Actinomadura litoris TaxID=2678616 RepID=A0A7K1LDP2_9ACTN|nr:hypothetical protein [Actinomadura litoris]